MAAPLHSNRAGSLVLLSGLAGVAGGLCTGCNPADFSELSDRVWVDARDVIGDRSSDKNVLIGYAPRNDLGPASAEGDVPQFMAVGDSPVSMFHVDIDLDGSFAKTRLAVEESTDRALSGAPLLVARNTPDGLVVGAVRDRSNEAYLLFGDLGEADGTDDFVTSPFLFESLSAQDVDAPLAWQTLAVAGANHLTVAATGPLVSAPDDFTYLEANATGLGRSADAAPFRCKFDPDTEGSDVYEVNTALGILSAPLDDPANDGDPGAVAGSRFVVGTNGGVRVVGFPTAMGDEFCYTAALSSLVVVDGSFEIGSYLGDDTLPDVFGAALGESILVLVDIQESLPESAAAEFAVPAPGGATSSWGQSFAVGDFDDDGVSELAVGDPEAGTVDLFELDVDGLSAERVKTLSPKDPRKGFGKAVASAPFGDGQKDLLVVGSDEDVLTYFRIFADDESSTDGDPRN